MRIFVFALILAASLSFANTWAVLTAPPFQGDYTNSITYVGGDWIYQVSAPNGIAKYQISTDTWTDLSATPVPFSLWDQSTVYSSLDNCIYVMGGAIRTTQFARYNISSGAWEDLSSSAALPWGPNSGASAYFNGTLYISRGDGATSFAKYNILNSTWADLSASAPIPFGMGYTHDGLVADDKGNIYAANHLGQFAKFNTTTETWANLSSLPFDTSSHLAFDDVGGFVYAFKSEWSIAPAFARYDPKTNAWANLTPLSLTNTAFGSIEYADDFVFFSGPGSGSPIQFHKTNVSFAPEIAFVSLTPANGTSQPSSISINVSTYGRGDTSAFVDFNRSLQAYFTFGNISGTTVYDSSTYGNNGTSLNGPIQVAGKFGSAMSFDGIDDYIDVPIDVSETEYTVNFWFKTTTQSTGIFSIQGSGHDRHIYLSGGNACTRVYSEETICTSGTDYADGSWHHLVHTYGGEMGGQKIYVDGVQKASGSKSYSDFSWQTNAFIGYSNDGGGHFTGLMDEVQIWKRALSEPEINASYNAGAYRLERNFNNLTLGEYSFYAHAIDSDGNENFTETRTVGVAGPLVNFANPTPANGTMQTEDYVYVNVSVDGLNNRSAFIDFNRSLVGYWSFENTSGATVYDSSTYGNDAIIDGNPVNATGMHGNSFYFDGNGDFIEANLSQDIGNAYTMEGWLYTNFIPAQPHGIAQALIVNGGGDGSHGMWLYTDAGADKIDYWTNDGHHFSATNFSMNNWYHLAIIFNGSHGQLYINGYLDSNFMSAPSLTPTSITKIRIANDLPAWNEFLNGTMDEVRIWNRALSEEEINASYDAGLYKLERNFANLSVGNYSFYASAIDTAGSASQTEMRMLEIVPSNTSFPVSNCTTFTTPNRLYHLIQNVSLTGTCFDIQADNITIDCNGYSINASDPGSYGIYMSERSNLTVKNCDIIAYAGIRLYYSGNSSFSNISVSSYANTIQIQSSSNNYLANITAIASQYNSIDVSGSNNTFIDFYSRGGGDAGFSGSPINSTFTNIVATSDRWAGFDISWCSGNTFTNVDASGAPGAGFYIYQCDNNLFTNVTANDVPKYNGNWGGYGMYLRYGDNNTIVNSSFSNSIAYQLYFQYSYDNLIYNNIISASAGQNFVYDDGANFWNTTLTAGTNIIGGPYIGGNYYSNYSGADANADGIGDDAYTVYGFNIDYLPLLFWGPQIAFVVPTPNNSSITSRTWAYINASVFDASFNISDCTLEFDGANETMSMQGSGNSAICYFNKTGISDGVHTLIIYANNTNGVARTSQIREFSVDTTATTVSFISPTPSTGSILDYYPIINASITGAALDNIAMKLTSLNYSFYDDSLLFAMNLDNNSDFGEGTSAYDFSKYGNHGTLSGATWTDGKYGNALSFDGYDDGVVLPSNSIFPDSVNDFAAEAWVNPASASGWDSIVAMGNMGDDWLFALDNGYLSFYSSIGWGETPASVETNTWSHVAAVRNNDTVYLYINGVQAHSFTLSGPIGISSSIRMIGGDQGGAGGERLEGKIDEIRIWNRSLSADEIKLHYYANLGKFNSSQWYIEGNISDDGTYNYNAWANSSGSVFSTETRALTVDAKAPIMEFTNSSELNDSILLKRHAYFEINYSEATRQYTYLNLNNGSSYSMNCNSTACWLNKTLKLGSYLYNISMGDYFNRTNTTETRNITINMTATTFSFVMVNKLTSALYLESIILDGNTIIFSPTIFFAPLERKTISFEMDGTLCDAPGDMLQFNNVILHYKQGSIEGMAQVGSFPLTVQCG